MQTHLALCSIALLACAACADDSSQAAPTRDGGAAIVPDAAPDPTCTTGQSEPCVCSTGGIGSRACVDGGYTGQCSNCVMREDTSSGTLCVPGRYEGTYAVPNYYPTAAGFCGLVALFGGGGQGSWNFSLTSTTGGEFVSVVESESCLELIATPNDAGVADAGSADAAAAEPLSLALSGTVNCATGEFKGEIKGTYRTVSVCDLGMVESQYFLKGPISARFDPETKSFVEGTVTLHEPPSLLGIGAPTGGSGTWSATLNPTGEIPAPKDCLGGVPFQDFTVPP